MRIFKTITSMTRSSVDLRPNCNRSLSKRMMLISQLQLHLDRLLVAIRTGVTKASKRRTFPSPQLNRMAYRFKTLPLTIQTMRNKILRLPRSAFKKALSKRMSTASRSMPWRMRRGGWTRNERCFSKSKTMKLVNGSKGTKKWSPIMMMW